jgi:acetyl esterase
MTTELGETIRFDLPGRLGDPSRALKDDPRADPRLVAALAPFGLDRDQPPPPVLPSSSKQELLAFGQGAEDGFGTVFSALFADLPPVTGVERRTVTIPGSGALSGEWLPAVISGRDCRCPVARVN